MFRKVYLQYVINYHRVVTQQGLKDETGISKNNALITFGAIRIA